MPTDSRIETLLRECTRFRRLEHVLSCPSTQDLAAALPHDGDAVFWADHQTKGRGRQQREWHDEPGADLAVTFRVTLPLPLPLALPAALPVAVLEAIEPLLARPLRLKWPNDLYLDGKKLCGVLIDAGLAGRDSYLIGVGVNCNRTRFPPDLEAIATSLALASGHLVARGELLLAIAQRLERMLQELSEGRHERLEALFRDRLGLVGQRVVVTTATSETGVLTDVDFARVQLDGARTHPLAIVRGIQRAP
jgi:BirA family biotin operon repressor/biotin-[acetyl-CoA-carboxylase] ligase